MIDLGTSLMYHLEVLKWGDELGTKKMGRPTDNPKPHQMTVKFDDECKSIIEQYSKQENVSKMEAVRRGVKKLKNDLKH